MKYCLSILFVTLITPVARTQEVGVNLSMAIEKEIELKKKLDLEISQRLSINPELINLEVDYNDLFDDFDLLPGTDEVEENGIDNPSNPSTPVDNGLDDSAWNIEPQLRSASGLEVKWNILKWLRLRGGYSFYWRPGRIRHGLATQIKFRPDLPGKKWRLDSRIDLRHVGEMKSEGFRIRSGASSGIQVKYKMTKKHSLYVSPRVSGQWDDSEFEMDRFRVDTGLRYRYVKKHQFNFGYRFQTRINRKNRTGHDFYFRYAWSL